MSEKISNSIQKNFVASTAIYKNYESAFNALYLQFLNEIKKTFSNDFVDFDVEIQDYKTEKSLNLRNKLKNYTINIRIKEKSIIAINILNLKQIETEQNKNLVSNGFKGFESKSKNAHPWKISSNFDIELLATEETRKELRDIFNKHIIETINSLK
jgi:hypothetical protein